MIKADRAAVGGVQQMDDNKWCTFFQVHQPCEGGEHIRCNVVEEWMGKEFDIIEDALDDLANIAKMLADQGVHPIPKEAKELQ